MSYLNLSDNLKIKGEFVHVKAGTNIFISKTDKSSKHPWDYSDKIWLYTKIIQ